jgi:uncharacterized protein YggT (Ycf19 family)
MVRVPPESSAAEVEEIAFVGDADGDLPAPRTYAAWTARLVYYLFALAEILIALRVLLKLIAASQESGFTRFIYAITGPLTAPFRNIVASPTARNGSTLEISSLLGIVVYLLACWLLVRLVQLILERPGSVRPAPPMPDE